ncbi:hypothetical protein [Austwickia sp. TVS 96-490-7B]|nr:hypothetical protein [Austwickia sp. TVS 96-490-7B]
MPGTVAELRRGRVAAGVPLWTAVRLSGDVDGWVADLVGRPERR